MKNILLVIVSVLLTSCVSQSKVDLISESQKFQNELNAEYRNPKETPLRGDNFNNFKEHPFFPVNLKYSVKSKLVRTENPVIFENPTSSGRTQPYLEYGTATFILEGKNML